MDIDVVAPTAVSSVQVANECQHSLRSSRTRFYEVLFSYSFTPDLHGASSEGSNEPVSDEERTMLKEWIVVCDMKTLSQGRLSVATLSRDLQDRKCILKDHHRLALFARDRKWADPLTEISSHRRSVYDCGCDDVRCICGEESSLSYIYNTKTEHILTVGTTCARTVKMASSNYKRCFDCQAPIRGYTLKTLGRCSECAASTKVKTGTRAGEDLRVVAKDESYDPSLDLSISLVDAIRIEEERDRLCSTCKEDIHRGVRGDGCQGWVTGRLCAACVLSKKLVLESGEDAVTVALTSPFQPFVQALKRGVPVPKRDVLLLAYIHELFEINYFQAGSKLVDFGKHARRTRGEVVEQHYSYVTWCRDSCTTPSPPMCRFLAYAALHDRYTAVTGWTS